ncbi:MAG: hypothetical protein JWO81_2531, partial [Alphaproteobacteria bacterium]|nr:hypothetical protein [Alphaproteobacteria bacterium]
MAELAARAPMLAATPGRFTYAGKILAGAFLVTLADRLFFFADEAGATLGLFAAAVLAALLLGRKALRRSGPPLLAAGASLPLIFALVDDPSFLALALFWLAVSLAVLLPRVAGFDDAWRWAIRLAAHACRSLLAPLGDGRRLRAAR